MSKTEMVGPAGRVVINSDLVHKFEAKGFKVVAKKGTVATIEPPIPTSTLDTPSISDAALDIVDTPEAREIAVTDEPAAIADEAVITDETEVDYSNVSTTKLRKLAKKAGIDSALSRQELIEELGNSKDSEE